MMASSTVFYPNRTISRAQRALSCSPFNLNLFQTMRDQSVPLQIISLQSGLKFNYTKKPLSEARAEWELNWLIQVGILRREVDGQGITDSFRLTPLGRQLVQKWEHQGNTLPNPSWWDYLLNIFNRVAQASSLY